MLACGEVNAGDVVVVVGGGRGMWVARRVESWEGVKWLVRARVRDGG